MENRHNRFVLGEVKDILLVTINAKWIHPSLALRLLKANLGVLEDRCEILEFNLRQSLAEMTEPIMSALAGYTASPKILGISVSIWNHIATLELLSGLEKIWSEKNLQRPIIVLGGPEVSFLPESAEIFRYADYVIRGEGEIVFRELCERIISGGQQPSKTSVQFINAKNADVSKIKTAYHLYTDEDITRKLIYVEASRGCIFGCEYCLSAVKDGGAQVREFPLEQFFAEMDILICRGVKTFKFLDRTFNVNVKRAIKIMEFFLAKIKKRESRHLDARHPDARHPDALTVHFEMAASFFPQSLRKTLSQFPPGSLRLEAGIQTLNPKVSALINRHSNPEKELENISFLRENTNAIIHADLIAGLPGEDLVSFGKGFDKLWQALTAGELTLNAKQRPRLEIQLGILKQLPGAPISRHNETFAMLYSPLPPYEVMETSVLSAENLQRIKNFARFWELIVNRNDPSFGIQDFFLKNSSSVFEKFMTLSDYLFACFGRNWGIDKNELRNAVKQALSKSLL